MGEGGGGVEVDCPNIFSRAQDLNKKRSHWGRWRWGEGGVSCTNFFVFVCINFFLPCRKKFLHVYDHIPNTEDYICVIHLANVCKEEEEKKLAPNSSGFARISPVEKSWGGGGGGGGGLQPPAPPPPHTHTHTHTHTHRLVRLSLSFTIPGAPPPPQKKKKKKKKKKEQSIQSLL